MAGLRKVALVVSAMIVLAAAGTGFYLSQTASPGPPSTTTVTTSSTVTSTTTSSKSATSSSTQPQAGSSAGCVVAVSYDHMLNQFGGCGFYFSVLYNSCCYAQNGTKEVNLGWTLILGARQSTGPSENATFGWDPAGPSTASGERLPVPANSTLFNGTLTIQWRLYNSTAPQLYAWIIDTFPVPPQDIASESAPTSCPAAPWPSQVSSSYQPAVQQIEQNPAFLALTGGLCYSYTGNSYGTSQGENITSFYFNEYNGTIFYPCGTFPSNLVVSQIIVDTVFNANKIDGIISMGQENDLQSLNIYSCPYSTIPVWVRSVMLVPPYTPAGPTINVTLYASVQQAPITNLTAVLSLTGRSQTFDFSGVSASNPLLQGHSASQTETVIGPVSVDTNATYPMTIEGSFQDGQAFSYQVSIQVQATTFAGSTTTSTASTTASCTGSAQGSSGASSGTWSYTFYPTVNYTGPWTLTYQGYASLGQSNPTDTKGNCSGTGFFSIPVTVTGPNTDALSVCATAQKMDSSNSPLILTVTGFNETSLPNGSVTYCGGVVP